MGVSFFVKKNQSYVYEDNFSNGIGDWSEDGSGADVSMDWYQSDSLRHSINTGSTGESDYISAVWDYGLTGDFDIEVEYKRLTAGIVGGGIRTLNYGFYVTPDNYSDNHIFIRLAEELTLMRGRYRLGGVNQNTIDNSNKPSDVTIDGLRFRITKSGALFTVYHDIGDGEWLEVTNFTATPFENVTLYPGLYASRYGPTYCTVRFDNFIVRTGTIVSP